MLQKATAAEALKHETAKGHREAEEVLLPRLTAIQSAEDYRAVIKMFYGFFLPVEKVLRGYVKPSVLADVNERRSSKLLIEDLETLGCTAADAPLCKDLPGIDSVAKSFGAMYVLEGSTLGGRMIAKMLAKNEAVPPDALRFFKGYGEDTGAKWKAFVEAINQQPDVPTMIEGAAQTFESMKTWMLHSFAEPLRTDRG